VIRVYSYALPFDSGDFPDDKHTLDLGESGSGEASFRGVAGIVYPEGYLRRVS
jgi:hypothetical protein